MGATVVPLGQEDAGEVLTLQRAAYVTEAQAHDDAHIPALLETLDALRAGLGDPAVLALGVRDGGRLVGAVRCRVEGRVGAVGRLVVAPDRQGRGLGGMLLAAVEEALQGRVERLVLFTGEKSAGNRRLYASHGYAEVRQERVSSSMTLVHLEKQLAP